VQLNLSDRPASVCVVEQGRNPSSDYYVRSRIEALGVPQVDEPEDGSLVVIVRYLDSAWKKRIEKKRARLAGVAYFMDDDLFDIGAITTPPLPYAARMMWLAWRHKDWLKKMGAQLWVSTPYLANKYRDWKPQLLEPAPLRGLLERRDPVRVFYHGTGLHRKEIRWLAPVISKVQKRLDSTTFEVFGRGWVERLYRKVPRTTVLHPTSWDNFRDHCAGKSFHIGLAPLLPHAFNAARSYTKYFDFVRCGAAGIFSNVEPFAAFVRHERDGLLVDNEPGAWAEAIERLATDGALRERIAAAARERAFAG
jgi:glycosyltransferase involved in cell wall biosynthesis